MDPADSVQLSAVAPGQLLSLFGADLAPATPFVPASGVAASSGTFGVFFNGIAAPILYSDAHQINVQAPFEIAGQPTVQMKVIDQQITLPLSETLTLGVVARQPTIFLTSAASGSLFPGYTVCGSVMALGVAAVAQNADGTSNDCANPAAAGSTVTFFVNGLNPTTPSLATGAIATAPAVTITPGIVAADPLLTPTDSATLTIPGTITGVAQLRVQLPQSLRPGPYSMAVMLGDTLLRERLIVVWVRAN